MIGRNVGGLPFQFASVRQFGGFRKETLDWLDSVATNSGTVSPATQAAINNLIDSAINKGYWNDLSFLWIPVGDWNASPVCIKHPNANPLVTRVNFVTGDYSEPTGYQASAGKYINSNWIPANNISLWSGSLGFYSHTPDALGTAAEIGGRHSTTNSFALHARTSDDVSIFDAFVNSGGGRMIRTNTDGSGFFVGSRTSQDSAKIFRNAVQVGITSTPLATGLLPTVALFIFVYNNNGSFLNGSHRRLSMAFAGNGLTDQQIADFYADIQTLYTAIGRAL